jgi:hypothetical protein
LLDLGKQAESAQQARETLQALSSLGSFDDRLLSAAKIKGSDPSQEAGLLIDREEFLERQGRAGGARRQLPDPLF